MVSSLNIKVNLRYNSIVKIVSSVYHKLKPWLLVCSLNIAVTLRYNLLHRDFLFALCCHFRKNISIVSKKCNFCYTFRYCNKLLIFFVSYLSTTFWIDCQNYCSLLPFLVFQWIRDKIPLLQFVTISPLAVEIATVCWQSSRK